MLCVSTAPIITPRLALWPTHPAHAATLWPLLSDPALYIWIAREPLRTLCAIEQRVARIAQRTTPSRSDQWLNWTVCRRDTGEAIGIVENTVTPSLSVQVAYLFAPLIWRRGYASEAMHAARDAASRRESFRSDDRHKQRPIAGACVEARLPSHRNARI